MLASWTKVGFNISTNGKCSFFSDYGGIYIDDDVLVIRSFDPLRGYDLTLGRPVKIALPNGIIIARNGTLFLRIWLENYRHYNPKSCGAKS